MNGERVGKWGSLRGAGTPFFRYEESWANAPQGRALSLSLPVTADRQLRGQAKERRSEEHTSELQSHSDLVCRLLLEKKKRYEKNKEIEQKLKSKLDEHIEPGNRHRDGKMDYHEDETTAPNITEARCE